MKDSRAAFTLIELLVVIAVIAILSVVVILTLNPAELLKQARDSTRLSDMATMAKSLQIYSEDVSKINMGSVGTVYLSIPDPAATSSAGTDCASLGIAPSSTYHCAGPSYYKKVDGTGWIPVNFTNISSASPIGALAVDPINTSSSGFYYEYRTDGGTGGTVLAVPESNKYINSANGVSSFIGSTSVDPSVAWVLVPGNITFGTHNFWVMKYDVKCFSAGNALTTPASGYNTYDNNASACTSVNGKSIGSSPNGYPIANIDHVDALTACTSIGAHLLTNDEYMTIATNAVGVATNWSGGVVGSGYVYSGHNDSSPAVALQASPNDTNGYYGEANVGGNQKRTLTLSNGSVVWDITGNVYESVQRSTMNVHDMVNNMLLPSCTGGGSSWNWCEFPTISAWTTDVTGATAAPSTITWNSSQGIGKVFTYLGGGNQSTLIFLRGGSWGDGSSAGVFSLDLFQNSIYTANTAVGFRCAY